MNEANKFDFSQGEWIIGLESGNINNRDGVICYFINRNAEFCKNKDANARLMRCAPEMIQQLIELVEGLIKLSALLSGMTYDQALAKLLDSPDKKYIELIERATGKKWS